MRLECPIAMGASASQDRLILPGRPYMTKLIYIGGYGRSGSTLFEALLAANPKLVACGETVNVLRQEPNEVCGCGRQSINCPLWGPLLASPERLKSWSHCELDLTLLDKILATKRVMIDSSKTAWSEFAVPFQLGRVLGKDFQLVHLVRDPRAVCWSIIRGNATETLPQRGRLNRAARCIYGVLGWSVANLACEFFGHRYPKQYRRVRYEDLARKPRETLDKTLADIMPYATHEIVESNSTDNRHQLFGNKPRFEPVSLAAVQEDVEWRNTMVPAYRVLIEVLTGLLRRRYGYD